MNPTFSGDSNVGQNIEGDNNTTVGFAGRDVTIIHMPPNNAPRLGIPFQAPPLPAHFVERPEVSKDLKPLLLAESPSTGRTLVISAIHGLGSVGKSTLAAALAGDSAVREHFCDGILWATLGQEPDLLSLLGGWVVALGDYNFRATSVGATSAHLQNLLLEKAVLLVVDDAWNPEHARHFQVGGARCQMLVTTREAIIADALGASTFSLDVMTPEQAMELLAKKLGRKLENVEGKSAADFAKAVGYLPLALELGASQVAERISWKVLLQDLQQEVARLKTLDLPGARDVTDEATLKRLSLTASLNLSVKRLPEEERHNFIWLGVYPEDVTVAPAMAATLWEMDERDAQDTLRYLRSKALLLPGVPLADGTLTFRLHDLFHDLARNLLTLPEKPKRRGDLPGLGLQLAVANAELLERYRQKRRNSLWHTLPEDGYIHEYLVWHLEKAGQVEEIHRLLREEAESGRNGWYEARERLGQTAGYLGNVTRAWELAEANPTEASLPEVVGSECRCALIAASLNSQAANMPVGLLVALVRKKVWAPAQGLAYALQIPDPQEKIKSLTDLADCLPSPLKEPALQAALQAAQSIQNERDCAQALSALADKLPENLLPDALSAALSIQYPLYRAYALRALADKLPEVLPDALKAAQSIQDKLYRAYALRALADKLPEVLPDALQAAQSIHDEWGRAKALSVLADKLPEVLPPALQAAQSIEDEKLRVPVLRALAPRLSQIPPARLFPLWRDALHSLSRRTRKNLLSDLGALVPVMFALGGEKALAEIAGAVQDVARWWR
ncbi:NB-ARC domain-containing protein [Kamptonema formosum]|uniref:NB-ARC domain-containing protein n=1 Tax=Kamptonema formosum TaxID=331992 RepID=UPI00034732DD|nr:NB-ARC domain-containing protein [Oscillatoria sp. PCC 10802]